jgi:hypothetical protein
VSSRSMRRGMPKGADSDASFRGGNLGHESLSAIDIVVRDSAQLGTGLPFGRRLRSPGLLTT